jgi:hypothetical protein
MHWFILVLYKTKNEFWVVFPDYMFTYIDIYIVFCDHGLYHRLYQLTTCKSIYWVESKYNQLNQVKLSS